jgi:GMP synthase-like glutamine amidotransferase
MRVLVFENWPCEDAAMAGTAFEENGWVLEVVPCYRRRHAPAPSADALLVLGGPMNVYEEEKFPFLGWETAFIREWVRADRPLLGLCLGAQLLSKATGGTVSRNPDPEIGHFTVDLTEGGQADPIFSGLPNPLRVVQWHQDTFSLPAGATLLATSRQCRNQAMRLGQAVGLQFHLEIGREKMTTWIREYVKDPADRRVDADGILAEFDKWEAGYYEVCRQLIGNFCRSVAPAGRKAP